jgi:Ni/Fe-hydrogenase subunit HybB-like protein
MQVDHFATSSLIDVSRTWYADWVWGLTLIVLTVTFHVLGLLLINEKVERIHNHVRARHGSNTVFVVVIGAAALLATTLHGIEGCIWAGAYVLVGALPGYNAAVLYSLSAITSYGHANLNLEGRWQLMGALEALNGMLLFGLTTASLIGIIQRTRELHGKRSF